MRAWLFVLAVLAIITLVTEQVASTEEVMLPSSMTEQTTMQPSSITSSATYSSSSSSTSEFERNQHNFNKNNINNLDSLNTKNSDHKREKPDPQTLVQIEKNLLSLFGFKKQPNIDRSKVIIPEAMKKLYAEIMGHELDSLNVPKPGLHTRNANTVRSFSHEESEIDNRFNHHQHRFRLHFNISSIPVEEKLKAAELTLSRDAITNEVLEVRHKVLIYDIVRPGIKGKREPIFLLVDTKTLNINGSDSVSLDVLPAVERWLKTPKHNHGLLVQVTALTLPASLVAATNSSTTPTSSPSSSASPTSSTPSSSSSNVHTKNTKFKSSLKRKASKNSFISNVPVHNHIRLRRSIDDSPEQWANKQPLLFTYTDDGKYKQRSIRDARPRRTLMRNGGRRRKDGRESCQRRPLYVDFSDVGWNTWIVAPPGYEAYYCSGDCVFPIVDHLNTTNHAIVQTLVNSISPSLAPKACCVPTQLSSICMLYLDAQNKVVLKNYQDMSVVGCGCR